MRPFAIFRISWLLLLLCSPLVISSQTEGTVSLSKSVLLDKIKGGWAGQTIGCAYGGPTEFCYRGVMIPDDVEITYPEHHLKNYFDNLPSLFDDVYMDLTFVDVFSRLGLDAPADSFANAFAYAKYPLWHANQQGRYNIIHGLMPPESGYWKNNPHADCIDYQIESDYAGLMSPGMPNAASEISDKIGHIMNYGDGWYGGVFIGAMYALAFTQNDIETIIVKALKTIPEGSRFRERLDAVVKWYREDPSNWKRCWKLYNEKYSKDLGCPELILAAGNIDATMNSAYVAMGLLYGQGDFCKTMEIATRCGQDSDCNPSSAAGVLATMLGYSNIPEKWMPNLREVESRKFAYSNLSLNDTYNRVYDLALKMIERYGGNIDEESVTIKVQEPTSVRMEQGFVGMFPKLLTSGIEYLGTDDAGQNSFKFQGCGIVVYGNISYSNTNYEAQLEVTVDGEVDRVMPLCSDFNKRTADAIYWNYDLENGPHEVSFKLLNPRSGVNIKANRVIYYVTDDTPSPVPTLQPITFNNWGDGFNNGTSADFNNDGIHDLFLCGGNMGGHVLKGTGVASKAAYQEISNIGDIGNVDFQATIYPVDFNGDGMIDLVAFDSEPSGLTADDGGPEGIFLGDGTGAFHIAPTKVYKADGTTIDTSFKWIWMKSADVADFNNDGRLDLVVCSDKTIHNCLLLNMGKDEEGNFCFKKSDYDTKKRYTIQNAAWDKCMGYVKAYDFNSDGYMDFMLSGSNKSNKTVLFINNPDEPGTFTTVDFPTHRNLPSFDFADVNCDGIPEIYFSGEYHEGWYNQIYTPVFDDGKISYKLYYGLPWQNNDRCMGFRSSAFVDWDGDGIIDIIETGRSDTEMPDGTTLDSRASKIRINLGNGQEWADPILTIGSNLNTTILADVNADGVIDYLRNGENELAVDIDGLKYGTGSIFSATINPSTKVYTPSAPVLNTPVTNTQKVTLSWSPASDAIGNETFEYIVFDVNGQVVAGTHVADFSSGKRKTPTSGNACQARQIILSLPEGEYTYGVQAVSGAYIGSEFAKGTFTIDDVTGIGKVKSKRTNDKNEVYDLQGRRKLKATRGVNVIGHKKIIL